MTRAMFAEASRPPAPPTTRQNLSVAEAEAEIDRATPRFAAETVDLDASVGRVLRENVHADRDQPAFDRITMDGIAFAFGDWKRGIIEFAIAGTQAAGCPAPEHAPAGHCFEVMTGAVLPPGCDCVVPVEQITVRDGVATLASGTRPQPMQFVHRRGSDHVEGTRLLDPGMRLRAPEIAVLASAGRTQVRVAGEPAIAILVSGDELIDVGVPIESHQVRRSNDRALEAGLRLGGFSRIARTHAPDDPTRLRRSIAELLESFPVLILSGGVSKGRFDYIPGVLAALGVAVCFHNVRQRPGKPMWFGTGSNGQMVFALPGNPVSTLVCLHRYVLPALERAAGANTAVPERVKLAQDVEFEPELTWFLPVRVNDNRGDSEAVPVFINTSGDFAALAGTCGFIELPAERQRFPAGFAAPLYRW